MSDSSLARRQIQLEAIQQAISDGSLTAQQIHNILLEEISHELDKPFKEVDMEYVNACEELLTALNRGRAAAISSMYDSNLEVIRSKHKPHFSINLSPRTGLGRMALAVCLAAVMLCIGLFIPEGWIITRQTPDEGQYIMQGIETPTGFGSVADAGPALDRIGTYDTTSWQEVVHLMGGKPCVPQWMPLDWSILTYNVGLTSASSSLTIVYYNETVGKTQIFQSTTYFELSSLHRYVEQNDEGSVIELENGTKVYITDNIDNTSAAWNTSSTDYLLTGSIPVDDLIRIVESMD